MKYKSSRDYRGDFLFELIFDFWKRRLRAEGIVENKQVIENKKGSQLEAFT